MVNATEENDMPRDKHWMALVEPGDSRRNQLHFVQNLDPLRVLCCSLQGHCRFVQRDEQLVAETGSQEAGFIFRDTFSHLRGGTPFELYRWPYFVRYCCRSLVLFLRINSAWPKNLHTFCTPCNFIENKTSVTTHFKKVTTGNSVFIVSVIV